MFIALLWGFLGEFHKAAVWPRLPLMGTGDLSTTVGRSFVLDIGIGYSSNAAAGKGEGNWTFGSQSCYSIVRMVQVWSKGSTVALLPSLVTSNNNLLSMT